MAKDNLEIEGQKEDNLTVGARGGAIAFILKASATVLGFSNQVILARILGAGGIGEVLLALSVIEMSTQIAIFGMERAMMLFVPSYIEKRDGAKLNGIIYFVLRFCLLLAIIFVFLILLSSKFISINIFHSEELLKLLPIAVIAIPVNVIHGVIRGILKGYKDTFKALLPQLFVSPFFRVIIFLLLFLGLKSGTPLYAIVAFISGEIIAMSVAIIFLFKKMDKIKPVTMKDENKKVMGVASTMIIGIFSGLIFNQAGLWILGMFTSTEVVGIYGVVFKMVFWISFPLIAFATIIPPLMSSTHTSGNRDEMRKLVSESARWILSTAMPIFLLLILEGRFILKYVFGVKFLNGYLPLVILCIGQLVNAGSGLVGFLLQMTGEHKAFMKTSVLGGILCLTLNFILVPYLGIVGAAISTAFSISMVHIVNVFIAYNRLSVLTLPKGLKFDVVFATIVAILYALCSYKNFYLGYHLLLIGALTVYIWKSLANGDLPLRLLFAKQ